MKNPPDGAKRPDAKTNNNGAGDPSDPLNPENLRLSQSFADEIGVKKRLLTIPVRKPDRQWFVRVHPDADYRIETAVLESSEDREVYLVSRDLWQEFPGDITPRCLFTAMNRQGVVFLWAVKLPAADGRMNHWTQSALQAAELAMGRWIRVAANMALGAYEVFEATANLPEPEWPAESLHALLKIAFRDKFIDTPDHPALQRLRGEL